MMRFRLLGPLEILVDDDWRAIGAPKWRSVLATLLIHPGEIVSADTLISEVWGDDPPARAGNLVSIYVLLFETLVRDGRRAHAGGDPQGAARLLTEALDLWHGRPLADVPPTPLIDAEAERLSELRLGALELRFAAELALDRHDQAVAELGRLVADHPLREGLWLLLMRALDGAGRHAEALEAYGRARDVISGQLGVDPGAELRQFHAELLAKDSVAPAGVISAGRVSAPGGTTSPETPPSPGELRAPSSPPRPAQLPAAVADFTGREEQVQHLCDPGQHQTGRPQRPRGRGSAGAVHQDGRPGPGRGRARGHRRYSGAPGRGGARDPGRRAPAGVHREDRYRFHDLLRVYAAERAEDDLPAAGRQAAVIRLLTWYLRTADAAATAVAPRRYDVPLGAAADDAAPPLSFSASEEALSWYDDERANLVAAVRQAAGSGLHELTWRLPAPLFSIFNSRGNWRSGARSATGWVRRRRRTTSPTPTSAWSERTRPLTCTGTRWS